MGCTRLGLGDCIPPEYIYFADIRPLPPGMDIENLLPSNLLDKLGSKSSKSSKSSGSASSASKSSKSSQSVSRSSPGSCMLGETPTVEELVAMEDHEPEHAQRDAIIAM